MPSTSIAQQNQTRPPTVLSPKTLQTGFLDVIEQKVVRLKGGSGDVVVGDAVPLVATASFRYNPPTTKDLPLGADVPVHATLFQIDDTGEVLQSLPHLVMEDVPKWLAENYAFNFTIKTSTGRPSQAPPESILKKTDVEWVRVLETAGLQSDLVEIHILVEPSKAVRLEVGRPQDALTRVADALGKLLHLAEAYPERLTTAADALTKTVKDGNEGVTKTIKDGNEGVTKTVKDGNEGVTKTVKDGNEGVTKELSRMPATLNAEWSPHFVELRSRIVHLETMAKTLSETGSKVLERLERLDRVESTAAALATMDMVELASIASNLEAIKTYLETTARDKQKPHR